MDRGNAADWMVLGKTNLAMKEETKGEEAGNYGSTACIPMTFKLLTGIIADRI